MLRQLLSETVLGYDVWCVKQTRKAAANCMVRILPERRHKSVPGSWAHRRQVGSSKHYWLILTVICSEWEVNGYFEQGNYLSRKTNFIDIWNMQPMCITGQHKLLWSALELSTSRRWLYGVLVQTYYVGLLSFCLHSTGLLRIYVCCSLNAVGPNSEWNILRIILDTPISLASIHLLKHSW